MGAGTYQKRVSTSRGEKAFLNNSGGGGGGRAELSLLSEIPLLVTKITLLVHAVCHALHSLFHTGLFGMLCSISSILHWLILYAMLHAMTVIIILNCLCPICHAVHELLRNASLCMP